MKELSFLKVLVCDWSVMPFLISDWLNLNLTASRSLIIRGYAATVRVKREETKGELESKLNFVDAEERKYRAEIAQLNSDIEQIHKKFTAILNYASRNNIPISREMQSPLEDRKLFS